MSDPKPTINITRGKKPQTSSTSRRDDGQAGSGVPDVASGLAEGVRAVWLAGLGAIATVEELSTKAFESLVEEGKAWEAQRVQQTSDRGGESRMQRFRKGGTEAMASLERCVRDEVNDMITQMGIPRREDVDALQDEVRQLSEKVNRLAELLDDRPADGSQG